ncbi:MULTISPECIES: TetR/AcrR family transcriptional regulator [Amycolatopsis]|uniref:DNA-binding transcriptional regulator, AcrR family n=2 Tax=Amycolatopsis TaxID=1813 RepID=A0A1I3WHP4_9PSEU|nr:TetR/AcrR family transcriptional regulator [Amycolatopsis sacchari]SFK06972.1 DNA-binding transcriptional regulator, AcrR family [Amycolatopsis sacchari]
MEDEERRPLTLRERSRQMAGREISDTALRLFTEQGFEQTTIAQIAREAGVSQRTLFRYFGTKEDLIGGDEEMFAAVLVDTVRRQPADVSAWTALRAGFLATLSSGRPDQLLERMRVILGTASLRARFIEKRLRMQDALLPVVEARMGIEDPGPDPRARALIAAAAACADAALETWVAGDGRAEISTLFDQCAAVLRTECG